MTPKNVQMPNPNPKYKPPGTAGGGRGGNTMSETRRLGDLSLGEHITIGNEVWEITGKNITGQVILEKVRNKYNPSWWIRSPSVQREIMEGPVWYGEARDKYGARIVDEMVPDKAYLYQLYATCFLEFDSLGAAKAYYE